MQFVIYRDNSSQFHWRLMSGGLIVHRHAGL
jgi:uncharacterized protein YegP (UPF0339 family)